MDFSFPEFLVRFWASPLFFTNWDYKLCISQLWGIRWLFLPSLPLLVDKRTFATCALLGLPARNSNVASFCGESHSGKTTNLINQTTGVHVYNPRQESLVLLLEALEVFQEKYFSTCFLFLVNFQSPDILLVCFVHF